MYSKLTEARIRRTTTMHNCLGSACCRGLVFEVQENATMPHCVAASIALSGKKWPRSAHPYRSRQAHAREYDCYTAIAYRAVKKMDRLFDPHVLVLLDLHNHLNSIKVKKWNEHAEQCNG
jgi:hypothetical protein